MIRQLYADAHETQYGLKSYVYSYVYLIVDVCNYVESVFSIKRVNKPFFEVRAAV